MSIEFDGARWSRIRENYAAWWEGRLERPLMYVTLTGADPGRKPARLPFRHFTAHYGLGVPVEEIVDSWDYHLSSLRYVGDAFPSVWLNFGPGILAAFIGANLETDDHTVWFHPKRETGLSELELAFDPADPWLPRIKNIAASAMKRWQGLVQIGTTDLGGTLDVLSTFRPSEKLLLDLYDDPERVKELTWVIHDRWFRAFDAISESLRPVNPGYTSWMPIFSETPSFMLQCDFSYMIGPEMFDEFVKPELGASCLRLGNPFYHMDGIGELPHLDSILTIDSLKGVQWVPGDGKPDCSHWPEVYRKIRGAGKLSQVLGNLDNLEAVMNQVGSGKGLYVSCSAPIEEEDRILRQIERLSAT